MIVLQSIFHETAGITDNAPFTYPPLAQHLSLSVSSAQDKCRLNYLAFLDLLFLSFALAVASPQTWETSPANPVLPQQNLSVHLGKVTLPTPRYQIASIENSFSTQNEISLLRQDKNPACKDKTELLAQSFASSALWQILCHFNLIYKVATSYCVPDTFKNCLSSYNGPDIYGCIPLWTALCLLTAGTISVSLFFSPNLLHFAVFLVLLPSFPFMGKKKI